jgi:hypothetical protein
MNCFHIPWVDDHTIGLYTSLIYTSNQLQLLMSLEFTLWHQHSWNKPLLQEPQFLGLVSDVNLKRPLWFHLDDKLQGEGGWVRGFCAEVVYIVHLCIATQNLELVKTAINPK